MKKIPKGLELLEVMIGIDLAVIAIAVFLSMQSGGNQASKVREEGQNVGLITNKILGVSDDFFNDNAAFFADLTVTSPYVENYYFDSADSSQVSLQAYLSASDEFLDDIGSQGVLMITTTITTSRDPDEIQQS